MAGKLVLDSDVSRTNPTMQDSYLDYKYDYLRTTHKQAFFAGAVGIFLPMPLEWLVDLFIRPVPLLHLFLSRVALIPCLYLVFRLRAGAQGKNQLTWVYTNFHILAVFLAYIGTVVDPILGFPAYVSTGFLLAGFSVHYPNRPLPAVLFPFSVGVNFSLSYLFFNGGMEKQSLLALGILMFTCPWLTSLGSIRLENSLRSAHELNRRLREEVEYTLETKARLATIIGNISDAVVAFNSADRVELVNQEAKLLLGRSTKMLVGFDIRELLSLRSESGTPIEPVLDRDWVSPPGTYLCSTEKPIPVRLVCSIIPTEGRNSAGTVLVIQDLSEIRKQEEKRLHHVRLESLGALAGGIAHDFNNVLTTIQGNLSLMELEVDQGHALREPLLETDIAIQKARELSSRLLTFSEGGEPQKEVLALAPLIEETVQMYLKNSGVKAKLSLNPSLLSNIDPIQMGQVFQNLVINAAEAMPGGGELEVITRSQGQTLEVVFADNGPGIPSSILDQVFDPYFSTKETGNGLGLATSYSIIKRHGGTLSAAASHLGGAEFRLTLPLAEFPPEQNAGTNRPTETYRALIMDDEPKVRKVTRGMLERLGLEAVTAKEGGEALRLYREAIDEGLPFSIVFIDLTVPNGMGGREMVKNLLEIDPDAKAVVASGYSADPVMGHWASYGFSGSLAKPYGVQQLKEVLLDLNLIT